MAEVPVTPQAGWYPDPSNPALIRWWDGEQWTHYTQPAQPPQEPAPLSTTPPPEMRLDFELEQALRSSASQSAAAPSAEGDGPAPRFSFDPGITPTAGDVKRAAGAKVLRRNMAEKGREASIVSAVLTLLTGVIIYVLFGHLVSPASMYPQRGEVVVPATVVAISGPYVDGSCAPIAEATINGDVRRAIARWNETPCRWQVDDPVRVIYDPGDVAATVRVDGSDRQTWPTVAVRVLGSVVLLLGAYRTARAGWAWYTERKLRLQWSKRSATWTDTRS